MRDINIQENPHYHLRLPSENVYGLSRAGYLSAHLACTQHHQHNVLKRRKVAQRPRPTQTLAFSRKGKAMPDYSQNCNSGLRQQL